MLPKGLVILFEGLPATVIDAQVMAHVRYMREKSVVDFEVWSFAHSHELYVRSADRLDEVREIAGGTVRLLRSVRPAVPFSGILNAILLWLAILRFKPEFQLIHARTDYSAAVCGYLKIVRDFDLIWDCRGDTEAEFRGKYLRVGLIRRFAFWYQVVLARWRAFWAARRCDRAIFVTEELRAVLGGRLGSKPYQIVPSVVSDGLFEFIPDLRRQTRRRLGYSDHDVVIVYSGSLAHYQCFPESVGLFDRLHREDSRYKFLALTPEADAARMTLSGLPGDSYQILPARLGEINAYLNAADYGVMLREHSPINTSSFPTKFAEYCLAGLPVIMQNSVPAAYTLARTVGNLCEYGGGDVQFPDRVDRERISREYQNLLTRKAVLPKYRAVYTPDEKLSS